MKKLLFFVCMFVSVSNMHAQENIGAKSEQLQSPAVNEDRTVTFTLNAPQAKKVFVKGSWMGHTEKAPLTKNDKGVWTYTTSALPSDLFTYNFIMDGVTILDPLNVYEVRDVGSLFSMFIVKGGNGNDYSVNNVPHGTVSCRWYSSPSLNMTRRMTVYTPPGYETSDKNYSVLYLLHGMGGDETAWPTLGRLAEIMDNLIAEKKAQPMIVAMPNGNVVQSAAPGASDEGFKTVNFVLPHSMDGRFESSFKDVLSFVESNYRVEKDKAHRAIAGLSMGGFHSLYISANNPGMFDYVGLFSPAILPLNKEQGNSSDDRIKLNDERSDIYDNIDDKLKAQHDKGFKLYWIGIGKEDFLQGQVTPFRQKLDSLHFPYIYHESPRDHIWSNWRAYMLEFVPKLFKE